MLFDMNDQLQEKVGEFWSKRNDQIKANQHLKTRWWQFPSIIEHINKRVSGEAQKGASEGLLSRAKELMENSLPLKKGISVGCGDGTKEIRLIQSNFVESFDLYELSDKRIEDGNALIEKYGLQNKVKFHKADAFKEVTVSDHYDLVHWNNALHHMFDVPAAVEWSRKILKPGGLFFMDEFVGAQRFQWSDWSLNLASRIRSVLPDQYLKNPRNPEVLIAQKIARPLWDKMIEMDPSEAADSHRILESVVHFFPNAEITLTGGTVYHLALNDILNNIDETQDKLLLDLLLIIDDLCTELGESHYAVALAIKE